MTPITLVPPVKGTRKASAPVLVGSIPAAKSSRRPMMWSWAAIDPGVPLFRPPKASLANARTSGSTRLHPASSATDTAAATAPRAPRANMDLPSPDEPPPRACHTGDHRGRDEFPADPALHVRKHRSPRTEDDRQ